MKLAVKNLARLETIERDPNPELLSAEEKLLSTLLAHDEAEDLSDAELADYIKLAFDGAGLFGRRAAAVTEAIKRLAEPATH